MLAKFVYIALMSSAFSLPSRIPYGWKPSGQTKRIPCRRSNRQNVLGFMGLQGQWFYQIAERKVTAKTVIEVFDAFSKTYYEKEFLQHCKLCFVAIDNASMHTNHSLQRTNGCLVNTRRHSALSAHLLT